MEAIYLQVVAVGAWGPNTIRFDYDYNRTDELYMRNWIGTHHRERWRGSNEKSDQTLTLQKRQLKMT